MKDFDLNWLLVVVTASVVIGTVVTGSLEQTFSSNYKDEPINDESLRALNNNNRGMREKAEMERCGSNWCHPNANCKQANEDSAQQYCQCKQGFTGNGLKCTKDEPCDCMEHAECFDNGQNVKVCVCLQGYKRKGEFCEDLDECLNAPCGEHADCVNTVGSFQCVCHAGFKQQNTTSCVDVNECGTNFLNDKGYPACGENAVCENLPGSHTCYCPPGYKFSSNGFNCYHVCRRCLHGGTCVGEYSCDCLAGYSGEFCQYVGEEFLLLAQSGLVKRISLPYSLMSYGILQKRYYNDIVAVDYDCREKHLFWADATSGVIWRSSYTGKNKTKFISDLGSPEGITVDPIGRNIFWTDSKMRTVNVASLGDPWENLKGKIGKTSTYMKVLFSKGVERPRGIVCHPFLGLLFWSDWHRLAPKIEASSMDGSNREVMVKSEKLRLPNGLALNLANNELCWTDAGLGHIACISLDGFRAIRILVSEAIYPFGIAFHRGTLYWSDWTLDRIQVHALRGERNETTMRSGLQNDGTIYDMQSITPCSLRRNSCFYYNGGCKYFCLMKNRHEHSCVEPDLFFKN